MYDIVVKNGFLIDPAQKISENKDLAIQNGKIADVENQISEQAGKRIVDASDSIVIPGMIDLHSHVAKDITALSIDPDGAGLMKGSTTMVDAGSTGELAFIPFQKYVIETGRPRILAFLNIESLGMIEFIDRDPTYTDQSWPRLLFDNNEELAPLFVNIENTIRIIRSNPHKIVGIKWAHHGLRVLELARNAADQAEKPIMAENHYEPEILRYLKKGDIVTHLYHHGFNEQLHRYDGISEDCVHIIPEIFDAVKRGIILDVGHGKGSFSWPLAQAAFDEGLKPDTISTDLWVGNINGPVYDMPTTMGKFLHLGMNLEDVVKAVTAKPAEVLGLLGEIGTLKAGSAADVAILHMEEGRFPLLDCYGESRIGQRRLIPLHVIRNGLLVF